MKILKLYDNSREYKNRTGIEAKVVSVEQLSELCVKLAKNKIVLMTGCFDLMHGGHVDGISDAAEYGDLIIGINSDKSVKKLKGDERPIRNQSDRAYLMAALSYVKYVVIFDDDIELIRCAKPNYYVASVTSHEKAWEIPDRVAILQELGTKVLLFGPDKKDSTTGIIKRVIMSVGNSIEE